MTRSDPAPGLEQLQPAGGTVFDHYEVQVARDSGFSTIVLDETVADRFNSEYTSVDGAAAQHPILLAGAGLQYLGAVQQLVSGEVLP